MFSTFITTIRNAILSKTLLEFTAPANQRALYLTFDDGPTPDITDRLLALLDQYGAKATFFVIGKKVEKSPELAKRIVANGHAIGNHSYSHPRFAKISSGQQDEEITQAHETIKQHVDVSTSLFRVPRGRWSVPLLLRMKKQGTRCVHWTTDSLDYDDKDAERIVQRILDSGLKPGQVLLFHDDSSLCLDVMALLLPRLTAMDFTLAPMEY